MHLTIRQLKIFECVARHLSYSRAAEELHLSQPAVSMQVKQLEESVGLPLLEKLGRKNYLTHAGTEVLHYGRNILQQITEIEVVINELKGVKHGNLKITVASTANYFVPQLLARYSGQYPAIQISLDVTNREGLLRQLAENTTDIVIMGRPPDDPSLVFEPFRKNPLVIVAPPHHTLATEGDIPLSCLSQETFLVRERGSGTRIAMERFFKEHAVETGTGMEMASNEAIKQSVQAGLGLGLLSRDTLSMELLLNRLVVLDFAEFPIQRYWHVVHRKGKRLSLAAQSFRQFLLTSPGEADT